MPPVQQMFRFLSLICIALLFCGSAFAQVINDKGTLNAINWKFTSEKLSLTGNWQVIWGQLIPPQEFDANYQGDLFKLPNNWNDAGNSPNIGIKNGANGVATFRLNLKLPAYDKPISFHMISPNSAWKMFLNGKILGGNGKVSSMPDQVKTQYVSRLFSAKDGDSQILLQIANFDHAYGGAEYAIELWDAAKLDQRLAFISITFTVVLGILFSIGLIHMVFYLADRKHREQGPVHLWFSLLCFILVYRISGIIPYFHIYTPDSAYWASLKLAYLSLYAAPSVYLLFFRSIFPNQFPKKFTKYLIWVGVGAMLITLITPEKIYTHSKYFAIALNITVIIYSLLFTIKALKAKQRGALAILISNFLFLLTALNDASIYILNQNGFDLTPFGFVMLGLGYSYALLVRLQHTFDEARDTSEALEILNSELEQKITERTKAYQLAATKAENSALEKAQFIAAASHDLRQPLHALSLFNLALKRQSKNANTSDLINKQGDAIESLGNLLQDTLDASKVESMRRKPEYSVLNMADFLDKLLSNFYIRAETQNIEIKLKYTDGFIKTDPSMLQRILSNLIDNGLKAAKSKLNISATQTSNKWVFKIEDDGMGISENNIKIIFDSYTSLDNKPPTDASGYGLGLYVVSEFTDILGGEMQVTSIHPSGSCFTLTLNAEIGDISASRQEISNPTAPQNFALNILTLDDEVEILQAMHATLESLGCTSHTALNKEQAQSYLALAVNDDNLPDLMLVDFHLHGQNGVDVVQQLQAHLNLNIPVIIISGATQQNIKTKILNAGFEFLAKPINEAKLQNLLQKISKNKPSN